jgi:hypothetical protein
MRAGPAQSAKTRQPDEVHPFETGLATATRWVLVGIAASTVGFIVDHDTDGARLVIVTAHLVVMTAAIWALTHRLAAVFDPPVFRGRSPFAQRLATDAALVALVTGFAALVTLAGSATLRYQPSLQFLQLLSVLDIAWTTSGFYLGVRRMSGRSWAGPAAGVFMGTMCVISLTRYLATIGFGADGGWDVQGAQMTRLVIPADVIAAVLTIGALVLGARTWVRTRSSEI